MKNGSITIAPNPVAERLELIITLDQPYRFKASLFTIDGKKLSELPAQNLIPGKQTISWFPGVLPGGTYLIFMHFNDQVISEKIFVIQ